MLFLGPMVEVHAFSDSAPLGGDLAAALGARLHEVEVHRFPDRESRVRVSGGGAGRVVLLRSLDDPNAKLVEVLLAADALRGAGARELTLVAPYLGYMRQDRAFRPGEAVSQRVVARLLSGAFDRVLTVEAHLHRIDRLSQVFDCRAESLSAAPVIADAYRAETGKDRFVVGPDEESEPWVREVARRAALPHVVARKRREGDRSVRIELPDLPPGDRALVVDDIASSGETLAELGRRLRERGVSHCDAVVVHALFAPRALERMHEAGIERIRSTDTVAHPSNAIPIAPLLAEALAGEPAGRVA